jgi:hypothetical protein
VGGALSWPSSKRKTQQINKNRLKGMARNLKTGWVIIATSGATVDGRNIEKEWLDDMAEHYNPKVYAATLKPDHYDFMPIGGTVLALKTQPATEEELEGETHLMAILAPNDWLIEANRQGQYIYTSIEVSDDFRGQGHFYLAGLGITNHPASAGTSELRFSSRRQHPNNHIFSGQPIDTYKSLDTKPGFMNRLFGQSSDHTDTHNPDTETDTMTPEQFAQLQNDLAAKMQEQFAALADKLKPEEGVPEAVTAEQFSALKAENTELKVRLETLETQFAELKETPAGGTDTPEGEGDGSNRKVL